MWVNTNKIQMCFKNSNSIYTATHFRSIILQFVNVNVMNQTVLS